MDAETTPTLEEPMPARLFVVYDCDAIRGKGDLAAFQHRNGGVSTDIMFEYVRADELARLKAANEALERAVYAAARVIQREADVAMRNGRLWVPGTDWLKHVIRTGRTPDTEVSK